MINWINGHTDMFKCLVNHDGIFNLRTLYYATEVRIYEQFIHSKDFHYNDNIM